MVFHPFFSSFLTPESISLEISIDRPLICEKRSIRQVSRLATRVCAQLLLLQQLLLKLTRNGTLWSHNL